MNAIYYGPSQWLESRGGQNKYPPATEAGMGPCRLYTGFYLKLVHFLFISKTPQKCILNIDNLKYILIF